MVSATEDREFGKETGRVEAFSDGVFAIAATLLVLDLRVPAPEGLRMGGLARALAGQWPMYLAYLNSFLTILIMWANHHHMFRHIRQVDHGLLFLNGLLLMGVTLVPFPTALLAEYIKRPDRNVAAMVYSGTFVIIAIFFNVLWRYATRKDRLVGSQPNVLQIRQITAQYRFGPVLYLVCFVLARFSAVASVVLNILLALYFAFTGTESGPARIARQGL